MSSKFRIGILGIGGVGGYIGGNLAAAFQGSYEIEIIFIARGKNKREIEANGLKIISPRGELIVKPDIITDNPEEHGIVDLIICCVKGYDLETASNLLKPCIRDTSIILPMLNGVEAAEKIKKIMPSAEVWNGCIYINSSLVSPGVVKISEFIPEIYFGQQNSQERMPEYISSIFLNSGLNAVVPENIEQKVWEKFIFLSPIATLTSYTNLCIGEILNDTSLREELAALVSEAASVAEAKKVKLTEDIINYTVRKIETLPFSNTSSMQKDFLKGGKTEIDSLTFYIVKTGRELNVSTPVYEKIYNGLINKKI